MNANEILQAELTKLEKINSTFPLMLTDGTKARIRLGVFNSLWNQYRYRETPEGGRYDAATVYLVAAFDALHPDDARKFDDVAEFNRAIPEGGLAGLIQAKTDFIAEHFPSLDDGA